VQIQHLRGRQRGRRGELRRARQRRRKAQRQQRARHRCRRFQRHGRVGLRHLVRQWAAPPWGNVFFANSNDGGRGWRYATECPRETRAGVCSGVPRHPPVAASANGDVYVAWSERPVDGYDGDEDIYIVVGRNRGTSFERGFNLSHSGGTSDYPELAISNSGVQVVWHDGLSGVMDTWHSRSIDGGKDFTERHNIGQTRMASLSTARTSATTFTRLERRFQRLYALSTDNGASSTSFASTSNSG
jgi:hypothetical protein